MPPHEKLPRQLQPSQTSRTAAVESDALAHEADPALDLACSVVQRAPSARLREGPRGRACQATGGVSGLVPRRFPGRPRIAPRPSPPSQKKQESPIALVREESACLTSAGVLEVDELWRLVGPRCHAEVQAHAGLLAVLSLQHLHPARCGGSGDSARRANARRSSTGAARTPTPHTCRTRHAGARPAWGPREQGCRGRARRAPVTRPAPNPSNNTP